MQSLRPVRRVAELGSLAVISRMKLLHAIPLIGLLGVLGCRAPDYNARVFHPWGCEDAAEFRSRMDEYRHVFMVCIHEDHWEDRGPNRYSLHHYTGTVVRVYKGDWRVSERISFVQGLDYRAPTNPASAAGQIGFVLTSQHADTEIGLDTGEFRSYYPEHAIALDHVFSQKTSP